MKWFAPLIAVLALSGCSLSERPDAEEVLYLQAEVKYDFETVLHAAKVLCERGDEAEPFQHAPFTVAKIFEGNVNNYNRHQAYLKEQGYGGPAEYPEKIPTNLDTPGVTDWCAVHREVSGLSCADDE